MREYSAVVIGCSMGGQIALKEILSNLSKEFSLPIIIVRHLSSASKGIFTNGPSDEPQIQFKEAEDKELLQPGVVYFSPSNYHLLIERDKTVSLSVDEKVNYSRPSIDVLFESAAKAYGSELVGVILTGANADGAVGLKKIHTEGGLTIVQEPATADAKEMPTAALKLFEPDYVLPLKEIGPFIRELKPKITGDEGER